MSSGPTKSTVTHSSASTILRGVKDLCGTSTRSCANVIVWPTSLYLPVAKPYAMIVTVTMWVC